MAIIKLTDVRKAYPLGRTEVHGLKGVSSGNSSIPWQFGPLEQPDLPLARMVTDAPDTPVDVPFHPAAQAVWTKLGYLS